MPDLIPILGHTIIPLTSSISLSIYLSSHPSSPFRRSKPIALPISQDEGLMKEKDPFEIWQDEVMQDGHPVDANAFWRSTRRWKYALLSALLLPFATNIALLVINSISGKTGDELTDAIMPQILLVPSHLITIALAYLYLKQEVTASHWSSTIHLAIGIFIQFAALSTLALLPNSPFPQPSTEVHFTLATFSRADILSIPPFDIIRALNAAIPILHLPPLAIILMIRRGPALHLPLDVLYPPKITDAIPVGHPSLDPSIPNLSEEVQCTIPEWLLFGYATNVIKKGNVAETMDVWDLPVLTRQLRALPAYLRMKATYGTRKKGERRDGYNILWKIAKANYGYLITQQVLAFIIAIAYYGPHWILQQLLEYLQNDPTRSNLSWGWLIAFGLFMSNTLVYVSNGVLWSISTTTLQGRVRLQLNTLLFSKTLRKKDVAGVSSKKEGEEKEKEKEKEKGKDDGEGDGDEDGITSKSQIMTLFTVDVDRVCDFIFHAFAIIDSPVELFVATWYLTQLLGSSAIYGLLAAILFLPVNHFASKTVVTAQDNLMKARDQRTALMNEVLQGIRMLKFNSWERRFQRRVNDIRDRELHWQARNYQIEVGFNVLWAITPVIVTVVAFLHYTLVAGHSLTPAKAFTSVAVFAELRYALNALPETFINALQSFVSCKRIEAYLTFAEVDRVEAYEGNGDIVLTNATFTWPRLADADEGENASSGTTTTTATATATAPSTPKAAFTLADLSLRFPKGELSLISGKLGSGKSLLLNGLLGEADLLVGRVDCPRSRPDAMAQASQRVSNQSEGEGQGEGGKWLVENTVAYVPQQAWLQNASIRDNILFSSPFDEVRYREVLEACSLVSDLEILEDGDMTEVGEKGLNLSGGQKARVSLARAVYSRAEILFLDDVLSAVDAHTAHAIMENCLTGDIVKGRTILLVSHHTALVSPAAAYIVALENGDVKFSGTRADFVSCGLMDELDEENKGGPNSPIDEKTIEMTSSGSENKNHKSVISLSSASGTPEVGSETSSIAPEDEETLRDSVSDGDEGKSSAKGKEKEKDRSPRKLIEDEKRATGRIAWVVWKTYLSALGGPFWWILFALGQVITMLLPVAEKGWLRFWTSANPSDPQEHSSTYYVVGYAIITLGGSFATNIVFAVIYYGSIQASRLLHGRMLESVLFSKLRFFDQTSRGRLLNRFGKDIEGLDSSMADNFSKSLEYGLAVVVTLCSIATIGGLPFIGAACIILVIYYQAGSIYGQTSRDMRRLDSVTRSPLYSLFGETVSGVAVYRAFGASTIALKHMIQLADTNILAFAWTWTVNRWLSARFNLLSAVLVGITAVIVLLAPGVNASMAGFALAFAGGLSHDLLFVVRRFVQLEQSMVALERIKEYSELQLEAPEFVEPRPAAAWPAEGGIEVEELVIRYAPDLPNVLHGISFSVKPREKIGVVGATGCGKSTLALSFFRFVEAHAGRIVIDGVDISKIGLTDLRSRLTIIPQDPTILSGTLRSTLDVFEEYDDVEIYAALRRVHLISESISRMPSTSALNSATQDGEQGEGEEEERNKNVFLNLDNPVSEGGENFSSGEKQLICMARAILKRNKVLFMDEATASIDYETDELISKTIREEFDDSTILTIAHRIHTIIDFDKVLVMDQGRIAEYASPAALLRDHKSKFYALCRATGKTEFRNLKAMAMDAERKRDGLIVSASPSRKS